MASICLGLNELNHDCAIRPGYYGPLFTKRTDVLPQDLVKSLSHEIRVKTFSIATKFDGHFSSSASEIPVKFQSDTIISTSDIAASSLHELLQWGVLSPSE